MERSYRGMRGDSHTGGCEGMTLTPLTRTLNTNSAEAAVHTDSPILTLGERENDKHLGELFGFAHAYVSERGCRHGRG
jgi:hypothetical protein